MTARPGRKFMGYIIVFPNLLQVVGGRMFVCCGGMEFGDAGVHGIVFSVIGGIELCHLNLLSILLPVEKRGFR
jgi:hypothetical protein